MCQLFFLKEADSIGSEAILVQIFFSRSTDFSETTGVGGVGLAVASCVHGDGGGGGRGRD